MADISSASWSQTDALNTSASPNGFPENMAPSGVDDSMRAVMGAIRRWHDQIGPTVTSGGSANVQTLTYTVAPAAYATEVYMFIPGFANTGATTLNVNGLGAKSIKIGSASLSGGELRVGVPAIVSYDGTNFQLFGSNSAASILGTATNDNAATGYIGEYVSSNIAPGSAVTLATGGTVYNVTSISVGAGDWDVDGFVGFTAGSATVSTWYAAINLTSASLPATNDTISAGNGPYATVVPASAIAQLQRIPVGSGRLSVAGTTTVYLVARVDYGGAGTNTAAYGYIRARRAR